ncbi:MAG: ABC transporter ATP-binding protein [Planctomycetota bacterium]|nr:ABC transporter ATP-binding protein [Planctomycetota bacterium]
MRKGEIFGFLGPNGAGKTTTIKMLMGILVPSAGRAAILGRDCMAERVELKRLVGYLPDAPAFYDYLRGREILAFVGRMHGLDRREAARRVEALFERMDLAEAADEFAVNYSTGMKKKLGLACALIHDPPVLILDEPTNGLDPIAARHIQTLIRDSAAEGRTIFLSTHLLDMAQKLCHRVGIVMHGTLAAVGTLDDLRSALRVGGSLEDVFFAVATPQAESPPEAAEPGASAPPPASRSDGHG